MRDTEIDVVVLGGARQDRPADNQWYTCTHQAILKITLLAAHCALISHGQGRNVKEAIGWLKIQIHQDLASTAD